MSDLDLHDDPLDEDDENLEVSLDEEGDFDGEDDETDDTYEDFYSDDDEYEDGESSLVDDYDDDDEDDEDEDDEDDEDDDLDDEEEDVESEVAPLDADELPLRGRREHHAVELIADDEFTCTECFLVKKPSQLADKENTICADCI